MRNYVSKTGFTYFPETSDLSTLTLPVLPNLIGKKWDETALAYVYSLRPSLLRVVDSTINAFSLDSRPWRVTVVLGTNGLIESIEQEVDVLLPKGVANAEALKCALEYGLDSEQVAWWKDAEDTWFDGVATHRLYKATPEGPVPFPYKEG